MSAALQQPPTKVGWEFKTLGDVCSFENGDRGKNYPSRSSFVDQGIPVINAGHLTDEGIDFEGMNYITLERFELLRSGRIRRGDILFCLRGSLGKAGLVENIDEGIIASSLVIVRSSDAILNDYLMAYFRSSLCAEMISLYENGAAQPNLSAKSLSKFVIPIPPLPEQERIVAILHEAFEGIATATAHAERNLHNARELFQSVLQSTFEQKGEDWVETTVGAQLTLQRGFDITKKQQNPGEVPVVSSGGVKSFHDTSMAKGPGVVTGRKGTIGKVHYVESDYWPHDTTLWVKDFKDNDPKLVYYLLSGLELGRFDSGTANPALNRNVVHPLPIVWPSKDQQKSIVKKLDALSAETRRLEAIYQRKLDALSELKQSLLQRAFAGEL